MRMRSAAMVLAVALMAGSAVAQPLPRPLSITEQIELGRAVTARNCGMCHAIGLEGDSPNRAAPPFRELGRRMNVDSLGEGLIQGILTGHPAMPEFRFTPTEAVAIVRYLRSVQEIQSAQAAPSRRVPVARPPA